MSVSDESVELFDSIDLNFNLFTNMPFSNLSTNSTSNNIFEYMTFNDILKHFYHNMETYGGKQIFAIDTDIEDLFDALLSKMNGVNNIIEYNQKSYTSFDLMINLTSKLVIYRDIDSVYKCIDILVNFMKHANDNNALEELFSKYDYHYIFNIFYDNKLYNCIDYCIDEMTDSNIELLLCNGDFMTKTIDNMYLKKISNMHISLTCYQDKYFPQEEICFIDKYISFAKDLDEFIKYNQDFVFKIIRVYSYYISDKGRLNDGSYEEFRFSEYYDELMNVFELTFKYTDINTIFTVNFNEKSQIFNIITYSIYLECQELTEFFLFKIKERNCILNVDIMNAPIFGIKPLMRAVTSYFDVHIVQDLIDYCKCEYNIVDDENKNILVILAELAEEVEKDESYDNLNLLLSYRDIDMSSFDEVLDILNNNLKLLYNNCDNYRDDVFTEVDKVINDLITKIKVCSRTKMIDMHSKIVNEIISNPDNNDNNDNTNMCNMSVVRFLSDEYWMRELLTYI